MRTMAQIYGDSSDHIICKCGYCITCGDCKKFGCGREEPQKETAIPNPGSPEARKQGCICPILDNARGAGYMGGVKDENGETVFVITQGCPLHDKKGSS